MGPTVCTTEVEEDVAGGPPGGAPVGPTASTTEVEEDVDGGSPGGRCRWVQQRPPLRLRTTSMAGPLGGTTGGFNSVRHQG
jgi:hypothetical protein